VLVNRTDVWGGYYRNLDGKTCQTTHPRKMDRGKVVLTPEILLRHFCATYTNYIVGLHTTNPDNTSRWGAADIDKHDEGDNDPDANLRAAVAWCERLRGLGFSPLLTDSNGTGGFHLRTLFAEPVPTPLIYAFMRWLVRDYADHGLPDPPETFPKQARLETPCGNWLRLPGRHHTRPHWSRVWDGATWLEGEQAIDFMLALPPSSPALIPADVEVPPAVIVTVRFVPPVTPCPKLLAARIRGYMDRLPHRDAGYGRTGVAYTFGAFLVRDLDMIDDQAIPWLCDWDKDNNPPLGEDRLRKILADVRKYGKKAVGCRRD
jgi:hypothetical protein